MRFKSDSRNRIQTFGDAAHAVALQSIGGGGGTGGLTQGVGGTRIGTSLNFTLSIGGSGGDGGDGGAVDMRSEEHTSELQSLMRISYAVFCLKKKKKKLIQ